MSASLRCLGMVERMGLPDSMKAPEAGRERRSFSVAGTARQDRIAVCGQFKRVVFRTLGAVEKGC